MDGEAEVSIRSNTVKVGRGKSASKGNSEVLLREIKRQIEVDIMGKKKRKKKKKRTRQMKRATGDLWEYNKGSNICAIRDPEGEDEEGGAAKYANIWQKDF